MQRAENDDSSWRPLLSDVLVHLTSHLLATEMERSVIASQTAEHANDIMSGFNEDDLEEWKAGVRNGVERNDWIDLIEHRTYISDCRMIPIHGWALETLKSKTGHVDFQIRTTFFRKASLPGKRRSRRPGSKQALDPIQCTAHKWTYTSSRRCHFRQPRIQHHDSR